MNGRSASRLRAVEAANAGVLAAVTVVITVIGSFVPHLGGLELLASVPLAILGDRFGSSAVLAAGVSGALTATLLSGPGAGIAIAGCTAVGAAVGAVRRRGGGTWVMMAIGCVLAPVAALVAVGVLYVLPALRTLVLQSVVGVLKGLANLLGRVPVLRPVGSVLTTLADSFVHSWWLWVAGAVVVLVLAAVMATWQVLRAVLNRLNWVAVDDPLEVTANESAAPSGTVNGPVPVQLQQVSYRYPGRQVDALHGLDLNIPAAGFVCVTGPNGSGKSTLARILAGLAPTTGTVLRTGDVGLGQKGGTALIEQRAESTPLGVRVIDDLQWGLPPDLGFDAAELLDLVGLHAMAQRNTATLSGGELQRLAIASALARRPSLLISDESTAMIDAGSRDDIMRIFAALPARYGMTVVHITHDLAEARHAEVTIALRGGQIDEAAHIVPTSPESATSTRATAEGRDRQRDEDAGQPASLGVAASPPAGLVTATRPATVLKAEGLGYRYAAGTPWENEALSGTDLKVRSGEGLVITGENGAGKSTLLWLLAGLRTPSSGSCTLDDTPMTEQVGSVALAFQHARLQLQRPTVREDILAAAGQTHRSRPAASGTAAQILVDEALHAVGLPASVATRSIDALSGGQQRRIALAGLLAAKPRMLVLDEPFAGVDPQTRTDLVDTLAAQRAREGFGLIIVSHDLAGLDRLCDQELHLKPVAAPTRRGKDQNPDRHRRRASISEVVLRVLPGRTPLHRLWTGTKLLSVAALIVTAMILPTWITAGLLAATTIAAARLARVPITVIPRIPLVLWAAFAVSVALAGLSGTLPLLALSTVLAIEVFALTALVTLTTQLSELAPALATLASPLARMGLPVDGWTTVIALTVRSIPLFLDECRTLWAARRLRRLRIERSIRGLWNLVLDFTTAILAAAQRRAGDFGREMTLRGGLPPLVQRSHRLTTADAIAATITLVVCGLCVAGTLLYHL